MKQLVLFLFLFTFFTYSQTQIGVDIDAEAVNDNSGYSVSLSSDGSIVAIGSPNNVGSGDFSGQVRIYKNSNNMWTQIGNDINGEAASDQSGRSVSLSSDGNTVAIGAHYNDGNGYHSGHVRIYENLSGTWTQIGTDIDGEAAGDSSGWSVSLSSDGSIVAIGALYNDISWQLEDSGHVRVFKNTSGDWMQIGADINGEAADDWSGYSVSLSADGNTLAIGAPNNDGNGDGSGHVRVYKNNSGVWTQIGNDINGEAAFDQLGKSVSLSSDGSILAVGAPGNSNNGMQSGHVRVYKNNLGVWTQIGDDINGEAAFDLSGGSTSLSEDGSIVAIGASQNADNGTESGHVRVYKNISSVWTQIGDDIDGEARLDQSGFSVSLSSNGNVLAIGAPKNDGIGSNSGHVRVYYFESIPFVNYGFNNDLLDENSNNDLMLLTGTYSYILIDENDYAISFDGSTQLTTTSVFDNSSFTETSISFWMKSPNVSGKLNKVNSTFQTCIEGANIGFGGFIETATGNFLGFYDSTSANSVTSLNPINDDVWHHIIFQNNGTSTSLYIDGELNGSVSENLVVGDGGLNNKLFFGMSNAGENGYTGLLNDVRIYNKVLSELEIDIISNSKTLGFENIQLNELDLIVYPNPVKEELQLQLSNSLEFKNVKLYNVFGQYILQSNKTTVDVSSLSTGIYFVLIETNQGKAVKKIIKE
jgi:Flp pilus assembly pilin Flp